MGTKASTTGSTWYTVMRTSKFGKHPRILHFAVSSLGRYAVCSEASFRDRQAAKGQSARDADLIGTGYLHSVPTTTFPQSKGGLTILHRTLEPLTFRLNIPIRGVVLSEAPAPSGYVDPGVDVNPIFSEQVHHSRRYDRRWEQVRSLSPPSSLDHSRSLSPPKFLGHSARVIRRGLPWKECRRYPVHVRARLDSSSVAGRSHLIFTFCDALRPLK